MITQLDILYTENIGGDLDLLPPLYTFMRDLAAQRGLHKPLWLDLGRSCLPSVWPCALTGGRSTLVVLDAMGYHAANVVDALDPTARPKLEPHVRIGLVDAAHTWVYDVPPDRDEGIIACWRPADAPPRRLQIVLDPAPRTHLDANTLYLASVPKGVVGMARLLATDPPRLLTAETHPLPTATPPHPVIVGTVDFVRAEARYYERQA